MSCSEDPMPADEALDSLDDAVAAAAFRRLVRLLRHRTDAANIDLMGLAGFCRNCLGDWIAEASEETPGAMDWVDGRAIVYGMPYDQWKTLYQQAATPEQVQRMKESLAKNP